MVGVEHRAGQAPAGRGGVEQGGGDEVGAHVVGDGPADQAPAVAVDDGREVEVASARQRQVGDVPDVLDVWCGGGEVPLQQVGHLGLGRFGDGGADPAAQPQAGQVVLAHDAGDALVVHPILGRGAVVELGGDTRGAVRPVLLLNRLDSLGERGITRGPFRTRRRGLLPRVKRRAGDLDGLAQPLHLEGVSVVGDELEAAHQFVSPAKYFAADLRISRSVASFVVSASSSRTRASSRASFAAWDSPRPLSM